MASLLCQWLSSYVNPGSDDGGVDTSERPSGERQDGSAGQQHLDEASFLQASGTAIAAKHTHNLSYMCKEWVNQLNQEYWTCSTQPSVVIC